jgi:hypothetical protein
MQRVPQPQINVPIFVAQNVSPRNVSIWRLILGVLQHDSLENPAKVAKLILFTQHNAFTAVDSFIPV